MASDPLPYSIRLIAGAIAQRLPARLHALMLDLAMAAMTARHPAVFDRLSAFAGSSMRIDITDLAIALMMRFGAAPSLGLASADEDADATVSGELPAMLALLEGRADGDALFFARAISIQGDTGLVLALRNAIDDTEIDLVADFCGFLGPVAPLARRVAPPVMRGLLRLGRDLDRARAALLPHTINGPR